MRCASALAVFGGLVACFAGCPSRAFAESVPPSLQPFRIEVVDAATGRGVPLVELKTTFGARHFTDNAGLIAFAEPGLLGQRVFFYVRSHGYEFAKDGFGYAGTALDARPGGKATLKLTRRNVAERLYRVTGAGLYRDTILLGGQPPLREPALNAQVVGQDSTLAAVYRGRIHWFWGDTTPARYPLGNFHTSGATSELPANGGLDPAVGVDLRYFTDGAGFCRPMARLPGEGMVWLDGLAVVADAEGRERLVAHYSLMKSLETRLEHGTMVWDDEREQFEKRVELPRDEQWRCLQGHPARVRDEGRDYLYTLWPDRPVRVPAELDAVLDPARYEAFTCVLPGPDTNRLDRDSEGRLRWSWRTNAPPVRQADEARWLRSGVMHDGEARFQFRDVETDRPVRMHSGSVRWNEHRQRWILIGVEQGGTSFLGEVWYAEARSPLGPWGKARRIVTHEQYSFYNPVHHAFFDQEGGRLIYFEGTYAQTFSGNPDATPWYDYNQILYRLDLDSPALKAVRVE